MASTVEAKSGEVTLLWIPKNLKICSSLEESGSMCPYESSKLLAEISTKIYIHLLAAQPFCKIECITEVISTYNYILSSTHIALHASFQLILRPCLAQKNNGLRTNQCKVIKKNAITTFGVFENTKRLTANCIPQANCTVLWSRSQWQTIHAEGKSSYRSTAYIEKKRKCPN